MPDYNALGQKIEPGTEAWACYRESHGYTNYSKCSVQFSSVYLIPFKQLHDKIQTQIIT